MKALAVTGATGFVGKRLVPEALARGWTVRALVRDPSGVAAADGLTALPWDAARPEDAARHLAGVDVLCHLAAFIPADTADPTAAERCFAVNALGTLGLLRAAAEAGVPRLVHLSTGNAYAPAPGPVGEQHPLYPSRRAPYYLASKLAGEIFADHWSRSGRLPACILRVASVYGPGMAGGVVKLFADRLRAGRPITLQDSGRYGVDLVAVEDVVEAILAAALAGATGPFNIGSGVRTTTRRLSELLLELTGADPRLVTVLPASRAPDEGFAALDISRARAELGYRPTELREGLARYLCRDASSTAAPPR